MNSKNLLLFTTFAAFSTSIIAKTLFVENFMQYPDYAPRMSPDKGIRCGTDPIWQNRGQVDANVKESCDLFRENIAVPADGFNVTCRFKLNAKQPKTEKNKETGEIKVVEQGEASFFDLAFFDKDGKRETIRVASDRIASTPVDFLDNGWKSFGVKVRGTDVEFWMATDRGHEFKSVAKAKLSRKPAAFNFGCTPEKKFALSDFFVKTADEPFRIHKTTEIHSIPLSCVRISAAGYTNNYISIKN